MILGILQARVSSSRLPGKVLLPILGIPMFIRQIERLLRAKRMDLLTVATSTDTSDDRIEELCKRNKIVCYRGHLEDVLDRFYRAASIYQPSHVVRLTADCTLADPKLIDDIIDTHLEGGYDYTTNAIEPTYPDGLDVEVFRFSCLKEAWEEAKLLSQREHVTPFIRDHKGRYKINSVKNDRDLSGLRWTVDEEDDFQLINEIYTELYPYNHEFTTDDILLLLERRPELKTLNTRYGRNEGYKKSLENDKIIDLEGR